MTDLRLNILISAQNAASAVLTGLLNPFNLMKASLGAISNGIGNLVFGFRNLGTAGTIGMDAIKQGAGGVALGLAGLAVIVAAIAAVIGVIAVKAAADFQQGLNRLVTGAGDVTDNMNAMGQAILGISVDTGVMSGPLLQAMYQIISAGQRGAQAQDTLAVAARGSVTEQANVVDVARALTTAMTDYGTTQFNATQFMNGYTRATQLGKLTLEQLSTSMGPILPLAKNLGINFSDVAAAMSTMTNAGIPADRAATSLRFLFQSLENPTKKATTAMQSFGLDSIKLGDELKVSLPGALQMVYNAAKKAGPEGSVPFNRAVSDMIGGQRSLSAYLALTGTHMKTFSGNTTAISTAMNGSKTAVLGWSTAQSNFNVQMSQLWAAVQAVLIAIGTGLLPVLGQIVTAITPVVTAFAKWIATGQAGNAIMGAFRAVMAFLAPILTVIGNFLKATFLPVWQQLMVVWNAQILPALKQLWTALQPLLPIFGQIAGIIAGVLLIALGLLIAILAGLVKGLAGLISGVITIFAGIVKVITGAVQIISGIVTFIIDLFTGNFSKLGSDLGVIWQGIQNIFSGALNIIAGFFQAIWGVISGIVSGIVSTIIGFFQSLFNNLVGHSIIPDMINGILYWFMMLPTAIGNAFSALGTLVHSIWDGIALGVKAGINMIISVINGFIRFIDGIQIHIPSIGVGPFATPAFNWNGLGIPQIPYLASGGYVEASGLAMIHQGETVTPARVASLGGGGGAVHHHYNITINALNREHTPQELATKVLDEISRKLRSSGGLVTSTSGGRAF